MRREWRLLLCAVQFMTRIPVPASPGFEADCVNRSAKYFPLAGQLVGLLSGGVLLLAALLWRGWLPALLAVSAGILLSGALHEDGFADTADGLAGGKNPLRRLEIMKDSRVGTYGVLALVLSISLRVASLVTMTPWHAACSLVAAHSVARAATVIVMATVPYAGDPESAKVRIDAGRPAGGEIWVAVLLAAWPWLFVRHFVPGCGIAGLLAWLLVMLAKKLIGGQRGDILGAVEQLCEIGFLLGCAA